IGAIGGAIWAGVIGLFVGAVVLAVGYEFFLTWIYSSSRDVPAAPEANEADVNR
ncbi:MAG: AI-2E family transporter, partial [Gammaproteobacteria bacterium]|nr:AI-2E family transporter [Gammaproteobacteria bacterium]